MKLRKDICYAAKVAKLRHKTRQEGVKKNIQKKFLKQGEVVY